MSHWLLDHLADKRRMALVIADRIQLYQELLYKEADTDLSVVRDVANALELATLDLILDRFEEDEVKLKAMRESAADAFRLLRVLPLPEDSLAAAYQLLRLSALAVLGDSGADVARMLRQNEWPQLPLDSEDWSKRTWAPCVRIVDRRCAGVCKDYAGQPGLC